MAFNKIKITRKDTKAIFDAGVFLLHAVSGAVIGLSQNADTAYQLLGASIATYGLVVLIVKLKK